LSPDGLRLAYRGGGVCIVGTADDLFFVLIFLLPEMSRVFALSPPLVFDFSLGIRKIDFWLEAGLSPLVF
jgi:hypothetical protein